MEKIGKLLSKLCQTEVLIKLKIDILENLKS